MEEINDNDLKIKIPFGMIISGSSNSGKSELVYKILENKDKIFDPPPKAVLFCYGEFHDKLPELQAKGINIYEGMPSDVVMNKMPRPYLLILDDLLYKVNDKDIGEIFTKKAHHRNFGMKCL